MNYFLFATISAFSICLPTTTALIRCKQIPDRYQPFLLILLLGLLNEGLSFILIRLYHNNLINSNIYTLLEYLLYVWFFLKLNPLTKLSIIVSVISGILIWVLDNLWLHSLMNSNSFFRIFASLLIIWFSIDKLSRLTFNRFTTHYKKTDLLLCFSFLAYFTFRAFIHVFKQFSTSQATNFHIDLWVLLSALNILVNISFFIAILWIPRQQPTTPYS
jgi:hypothetical protein